MFRKSRPGHSVLISILALSLSFSVAAFGAQAAPEQVIGKFNSALLEAMKRANELGFEGRYKLLEPVVKESFALNFMAGKSAGSYWNSWNDRQKNEYQKTYDEWTVATYAGRFDGYSGEEFEVAPAGATAAGVATVESKLIQQNKKPVEFMYKLRNMEGGWKVVDIQISGVSQLALTRSQFVSVIRGKGFDGLIALLRSKIDKFRKGD